MEKESDKKEILNKIEDLQKHLDIQFEYINLRLNSIENTVKKNQDTCSKMSTHIDFVENTYDQLKQPLFFMKKKIDYLIGTNIETPQIQDK